MTNKIIATQNKILAAPIAVPAAPPSSGRGVIWMHDDKGRPFVIHDDHPLVPGDSFACMPGNPYLLGPDRGHDSRCDTGVRPT